MRLTSKCLLPRFQYEAWCENEFVPRLAIPSKEPGDEVEVVPSPFSRFKLSMRSRYRSYAIGLIKSSSWFEKETKLDDILERNNPATVNDHLKTNIMNQEKLSKLQNQVRIGGKGTPRRKKKVLHRTATTDDKKLQNSLKKLGVNTIPGIEEVNMIKHDATVIHFNNPKVQASLGANTFAISGHGEIKSITEMLPGILNQLGSDSINDLKRLAEKLPHQEAGGAPIAGEEGDDDDVPELVGTFDEPSKTEGV